MGLDHVQLGRLSVSRFIIGGNPFSGFSHQGRERDEEMRRWYTAARIKEALAGAAAEGVDTFLGRGDNHVIRLLLEYRQEGGTIQWIAQTTPELASLDRAIDRAVAGGAQACFIHGGQMDNLLGQNRLDLVPPALERIRGAGLPAGVAGHDPGVFRWAEVNADVDFYMCSYYNPSSRAQRAEHVAGAHEWFGAQDRQAMATLIQGLRPPVIHYKVMAAGRNDPDEAFAFAAAHMRPGDAVCVGIHTRDNPHMVRDDVECLQRCLAAARAQAA